MTQSERVRNELLGFGGIPLAQRLLGTQLGLLMHLLEPDQELRQNRPSSTGSR